MPSSGSLASLGQLVMPEVRVAWEARDSSKKGQFVEMEEGAAGQPVTRYLPQASFYIKTLCPEDCTV